MKKKRKLLPKLSITLAGLALSFAAAGVIKQKEKPVVPTFATYTNGDAATYYDSIDSTQSGNTLLTALRTLNLSKRQSTVGYNSMGTSTSGQFKYTDYDTNYVQYDSNGQPYGTKISSFYTYTSATSWNREHVWPNSHGGGSGGDAGTPYPDADIHMPRPTISSENSSRGNSFYVEGMNHSSNGWDPYTAGYSENSRGEAARITFYCTLVNSKLLLAPSNTSPSGKDSVTGQSFGSGHTMGNLETLIKWNINYPVTQREKNRNEGAEYLQGNRNAFVDHPEYACRIWGNVNSTIKNMCDNANWDVGPSVSISRSAASITVDDTTLINATASDSSTISWSSSDNTVVTVSSASSASGANITLTGIGPGTATITARATINSTVYSATCTVTVSSSGSGGGDTPTPSAEGYSIVPTDLANGAYPTTATSYTTASGISVTAYNTANFSSKIQFKKNGGYLYNNSSLNLGTLTLSGVSGSLTVYAGTTRNPSTTTISGSNGVYNLSGYNYFKIINNSGSVATCSGITVGLAENTAELTGISVKTAPTKTTYIAGESFDPTGLVITRSYSDSSSDTYTYAGHTSEFTFSPTTSAALTTSNTSVTITYGGFNCNQAITVNAAKTLSSISVSTAPTKVSYTTGETFDPTGLVIKRNYSDSTYDTYTYASHTSEFTFSPSTSTYLTTSNTSVTITYGGKSCNQAITVTAPVKTLSSISVQTAPTKTSYTVDEYFNPSGLVITRNYSDYTSDTYTYANHASEFTFSPSLSTELTTANTKVTITYGGKSCDQSISVTASGGGGETQDGSQRISASASSTYYQSGDICPTGNTTSATATCDAFDVSWLKNAGSSNIAYNYAEIRVYTSHSFTITPKTDYTITSVVITANNSSYATAVGGSSLTNCIKNVNDSTVTLTPTDGTAAVGFTNNAQSRLNYIVVNYQYEGSGSGGTDPITGISATVNKTFYVGETISKSDITVKDNLNNEISSFTFVNDGYRFTYDDAASGGSPTNKVFSNSISYQEFGCSLTVTVQRKAYSTDSEVSRDVTYTDLPTAYQASTTERTAASGIKFIAYNLANYSSKMQFRASDGYFETTEEMALVSLTINNRESNSLTVYGSNVAGTFSETITGTNDVYDLTGYTYVKVQRISSGAAYCSSLTITTSGVTATNVANYIMYEDTNNQCVEKLPTAINYLKELSSVERSNFETGDDYVISTARERLEAWALSQGKTINYSSGELTNRSIFFENILTRNDEGLTLIIIVSMISVSSVGLCLIVRKKRQNLL